MPGMITYAVEGRTNPGYLALPQGGTGPGVLVLHAWWGLNDFFKGLCDRFAQAGFVAFAPDLYEGKGIARTIDEAQQLQRTMNEDETAQGIKGALAFLLAQPQTSGKSVGAVGFSMGSYWALLLKESVSAIVVFYGVADPDDFTANAAVSGHFAEHDEYEPEKYRLHFETSLRERGKDVTFYLYPGTGHWFFEEDRPEYNAQAAQLAWERTISFLEGHLKG